MKKSRNKVSPRRLLISTGLFLGGLATVTSASEATIYANDKLEVYGDFRLRLEHDWDSQKANGDLREDRTRARIRLRLGVNYEPTDYLTFGARVRSGFNESHQSAHITVIDFDGNDTGSAHFNFDKYFVKFANEASGSWAWAGRNSIPIWKQNDVLFDSDVTALGLGAGWETKTNGMTFGINSGYLKMPVGMQDFSGNLALGQVYFGIKSSSSQLGLAAGYLKFDNSDADAIGLSLLNGDGTRDYGIWTGSVKFKTPTPRIGIPMTIGFDYFHNEEDYSPLDTDPFTAANWDQTDGFVGSIAFGKSKKKGDWLVGYYHADIEALAVNSSFAGDDWVRWGSSGKTRATNMKGNEVRFGYAISDKFNMVARIFIVEAKTTIEDGNRFRLDFNYKF